MLKSSLFAACIALACSTAGAAYATDAGKVSVNPGLWNWGHQTKLAGQPFSESNTECLPEDDASFSIQQIADSFNQSCIVSDVAPQADGYVFKMTCSGFYTGEAQGSLTRYSADNIGVSAIGTVTLGGITAPFEFDAKADRIGECTAG